MKHPLLTKVLSFAVLPLFLASPLSAANAKKGKGPSVKVPDELEWTMFADPKIAACTVAVSCHPDGSVFVAIDKNGSLGKGSGKGYILKFVDTNNDGVADAHTTFANLESVRGLTAVGDKLYVLHSTWKKDNSFDTAYVSVVEDKNKDGVADGPAKTLVTGISAPKYNNARGVDHSTNGFRMGIDGWIYIAMGDFGIVDATGTDGKKLTVLGGGVVRVRPDGTEIEEYVHGLRNIFDVSIDPFMNIYTRGNTNDGGGWNVRFIHEIQSGQYGYPILFKRYTNEILPALIDVGGGSGTGSMFFQEPGWPEKYNNVPLMGDWGRSHIYIHRLTPNGASFTQKQENYLQVGKLTDLDVDGSGRLYVGSWEGSGYKGGDGGYVVRITPKGWAYKPFPDLSKASAKDLVTYLESDSATWRFHASQEIIERKAVSSDALVALINKKSASLESRVAAIFTLKQLDGPKANAPLFKAAQDASVREWALRAIADRLPQNKGVDIAPFVTALKDASNPRTQVAAAVALGRIGNKSAAKELIAISHMPNVSSDVDPEMIVTNPKKIKEGPHATPNKDVILPHIAVQALIALHAADECIEAVGTSNASGAYWAMRYMHDDKLVKALADKLSSNNNQETEQELVKTLVRLYNIEAPYDGSWWWSTKPDTRGPYYKPVAWSGTPIIEKALKTFWAKASDGQKGHLARLMLYDRVSIEGIDVDKFKGSTAGSDEPDAPDTAVDLKKILNQKGQIGKMSVEDVILAMDKVKGDVSKGEALFMRQGCVVCHSYKEGQPAKGPYMGAVGGILKREEIAMSILRPNASISQGFHSYTIVMKDGTSHVGFITSELDGVVTLTNIAGQVTKLKDKDIKERQEMPTSMMPPGLAAGMSVQEFVDLVDWLKHNTK